MSNVMSPEKLTQSTSQVDKEHKEVCETEPNVVLIDMRGLKDPIVRPSSHKIPKNLTISIGVVDDYWARPIRVAYSNFGSNVTHAYLESKSAPHGTDYRCIKACLQSSRKKGERARHILTILIPSQEDQEKIERYNVNMGNSHPDPLSINSVVWKAIAEAVGADDVRFCEDIRFQSEIREVMKREANKQPKSGIEHLVWAQQNRCGD